SVGRTVADSSTERLKQPTTYVFRRFDLSLLSRKFKGKDIVDNSAQVSNTTTIAPGMYKLDTVILAPKVKNNREAHEYYLKHTMEQAAILRELIQELLGYVRDTCPDIHKPSEKLVAVTPINKKKTVRFANTVTSSSNIPKVPNRPLLSSTGVNLLLVLADQSLQMNTKFVNNLPAYWGNSEKAPVIMAITGARGREGDSVTELQREGQVG
ncbi:hypothetical protein Tco_0989079, partial [Tanacetum coccineum]